MRKRIRPRSVLIWSAVVSRAGVGNPRAARGRTSERSAALPPSARTRSRTGSTRASSPRRCSDRRPAGHAVRAPRQRHDFQPPTGACCSATTSRRSPAQATGARCWPPRGLPAGHHLDHRGGHLRRRGAGHGDSLLLHAPDGKSLGRWRATRSAGGRRRGPHRGLLDHDHPAAVSRSWWCRRWPHRPGARSRSR